MTYENHINLPDGNDNIYCRKRDKVVEFTNVHQSQYCNSCEMFAGSAQGDGVECTWNDPREGAGLRIVKDPAKEADQLAIADMTTTKKRLVVDK